MTWADTDLDFVLVFKAKEGTGLIPVAWIGVIVSGDADTALNSFDMPCWSGSTVKCKEFLEGPASSQEEKSCCQKWFLLQAFRSSEIISKQFSYSIDCDSMTIISLCRLFDFLSIICLHR